MKFKLYYYCIRSFITCNSQHNSLAHIDPDLLASLMSRTRRVNLVNTSLTALQVTGLLRTLTSSTCRNESLDLSFNQLSMMEPELLAEAVNKLKDATLLGTGLSVNQVLRIHHTYPLMKIIPI